MNRSRAHSFTTTVEYAECINTKVEVTGSYDEGVTAVYAIGIGHVGEDITESLSWNQMEDLDRQLREWIIDDEGDAADRLYDERRDEAMLSKLGTK